MAHVRKKVKLFFANSWQMTNDLCSFSVWVFSSPAWVFWSRSNYPLFGFVLTVLSFGIGSLFNKLVIGNIFQRFVWKQVKLYTHKDLYLPYLSSYSWQWTPNADFDIRLLTAGCQSQCSYVGSWSCWQRTAIELFTVFDAINLRSLDRLKYKTIQLCHTWSYCQDLNVFQHTSGNQLPY